jgi:hypothetical protein
MDDEQVKKKIKDGWLKSWMMIEVLAINKDTAESALKTHIDKMSKEDKVHILKVDYKKTQPVKAPFEGIEKAFSQVVEVEVLTNSYEKLMYLTLNYGPSAIEILEPDSVKMDLGQAQGILNSIAEMIHRFAAAGMGGVVINR